MRYLELVLIDPWACLLILGACIFLWRKIFKFSSYFTLYFVAFTLTCKIIYRAEDLSTYSVEQIYVSLIFLVQARYWIIGYR